MLAPTGTEIIVDNVKTARVSWSKKQRDLVSSVYNVLKRSSSHLSQILQTIYPFTYK